jgi:hypothetical protein
MEIYDSESKGVRAQLRLDGRKIVVLAGSRAVGDAQVQHSLGEKPGRVGLRAELIRSGRLAPEGKVYRFAEDVEFNSPSAAASIIWGSNLNGRKVFGLYDEPPPTHMLHFQIDSPRAIEGYKRDQVLYVSDRNRALANQRKAMDGHTCKACELRLSVEGRFVIECHHLDPISMGQRETTLNDLVSLCPTCHRIAHMREPIYAIDEITKIRERPGR